MFWTVTLILMLSLGIYWCAEAYQNWVDQPVLTTITTAGLPVERVDFPAVTICSSGRTHSNIEPAFYNLFINFLLTKNITLNITSLDLSLVLRKYTGQNNSISEENLIKSLENYENTISKRNYSNEIIRSAKNLISGPLYAEFLNTNFPGVLPEDDIISLLKLMSSKNPMNDLAAKIALDGGYNPCTKFTGNESFWDKNAGCDFGFIPDYDNGYCYGVLPDLENLNDGENKCNYNYAAEMILFNSNSEVNGFINLIQKGQLGDVKFPFYVMATRMSHGYFYFENSNITNYSSINFQPDRNDLSNFQCLTGWINSTGQKLYLTITDCVEKHTVICRKVLFVKPNCRAAPTFINHNPFALMFDPKLRKQNKLAIAYIIAEMTDVVQRLDQSAAYQSIFQTLWYSSLPCFDIRNITAFSNGASSLLRYCEWKGMPISCSAIFTTFPTDQGMCCSFNMKAADEIYVESAYRDMLQTMQTKDKNTSFLFSAIPSYYIENKEPKTIPGRNKGLVLMLDTHADWLAPGSMDGDFGGFTAFIESSGSFPLMSQEGLPIKPGYNNIVTLTSSLVKAEENMRSLDKHARDCLFTEENDGLRLHKKYTYLNCKFECTLFYTQSVVAKKYNNKTCQPWFFPTSSESISICDPWQSYDFFQIMTNEIPDNICPQCLPDCSVTIYNPTITVEPFDTCDANNIGVSQFCSINLKQPLPMQMRLVSQIQNEYFNPSTGKYENAPDYVMSLKSSIRNYGYDIFKKPNKTYDAFDEDIAMVQILYQKSTAILMGSQLTMTWIDYFSAVGGLLGLVLGMGFVSFIELVWLGLRIIALKLNLKNWIS